MTNKWLYRNLDPVFAFAIGSAAAATRINREEKEKGKSTDQTIESLRARVGKMFGSGEGKGSAQ